MQHRYTGDIGDYLKLALLRAIPAGRRLAVCWWLHPDEGHNDDGRHTGYLDQPGRWRDVDQELFEKLADIVRSGQRSVHKLEASTLDRTVKFHSDPVPIGPGRGKAREPWFRRLVHTVEGSDVIFLDPDNGIDLHLDALRRCSAKHTTIPEIDSLSEGGQTLVIYHHQTRAKGGHDTEIARIQLTLESLGRGRVTAIRARPFSPRVFFVVGPDIQTHECLEEFSKQFPEFFQVYEGNTDRLTRPTNLLAWQSRIITLYPEMFPGPLGVSIAGRALADGTWSCTPIQLRDFATDKHRTVDDTPAGGGAGMVLRADIVAAAVDHALAAQPDAPILAMTPRGKPITQARIRELAAGPGVTILCGRFEGFDERLFEARPQIEQVSMGDIILSGGEPAALMLLDACIRLLPGVMGAPSSGVEESFENGLLEYPHYTRPVEWEGCTIPEVLRSGDHAKIAAWRKHQAEVDTRLRRPDLWERHEGARAQPASGARRKNKDQMGHEPHPDDRSGTDR